MKFFNIDLKTQKPKNWSSYTTFVWLFICFDTKKSSAAAFFRCNLIITGDHLNHKEIEQLLFMWEENDWGGRGGGSEGRWGRGGGGAKGGGIWKNFKTRAMMGKKFSNLGIGWRSRFDLFQRCSSPCKCTRRHLPASRKGCPKHKIQNHSKDGIDVRQLKVCHFFKIKKRKFT